MELTSGAEYAIRAMLDIAFHYPTLRTNRRITEAMDLPRNFLSQILASLVRNDLLVSTAGPAGGYTLARPPAEITLLQVIEVMEGPVALDTCALRGGTCDWSNLCPLHETWSEAKAGFANRLGSTTFGDLAAIDRSIRDGTYRPPDHTPPHAEMPPRRGKGAD